MAQHPPAGVPTSDLTVLVVEDDPDLLISAPPICSQQGMQS